MFGYVIPLKPELKIKEYNVFRGYYCGLCKCINREYSFFSRMFLNYDCAFLYLLFSSLSPEKPEVKSEACAFNPLLKKHVVRSAEGFYSAGINALLSCHKLHDNAIDDRNYFCYILKWLFKGVYKKAAKKYPETAHAVEQRLNNLRQLETAGEKSLDKPAHEFACLNAELFSTAPFLWLDDEKRGCLYDFGYNLGRFLYILDAYDDIEKDLKKKSYNPLLLRFDYSGDIEGFRKKIKEDLEFNLYYSLSEAAKAYEALKVDKNRDLLQNIIYLGLKSKASDIMEGRKKNGSL